MGKKQPRAGLGGFSRYLTSESVPKSCLEVMRAVHIVVDESIRIIPLDEPIGGDIVDSDTRPEEVARAGVVDPKVVAKDDARPRPDQHVRRELLEDVVFGEEIARQERLQTVILGTAAIVLAIEVTISDGTPAGQIRLHPAAHPIALENADVLHPAPVGVEREDAVLAARGSEEVKGHVLDTNVLNDRRRPPCSRVLTRSPVRQVETRANRHIVTVHRDDADNL